MGDLCLVIGLRGVAAYSASQVHLVIEMEVVGFVAHHRGLFFGGFLRTTFWLPKGTGQWPLLVFV